MKKLTLKHAMKMAKIVKAAQLKGALSELVEKVNSTSSKEGPTISTTKVGAEIIITVFEACAEDQVEKQLYELLDDVFETNTADMSLEALVENFKKLGEENNLTSFFKSASHLSK